MPTPAPRRSVRAWLASLSGARLLAWTGAGVTLLGVVLLLALAAARGWFAPPVRVGAGAVLGLALVGLGMRLHRRETARTGALAVTGTGIATLYLVVAAATALYRYLPVPVGLLLALLVAAGGLALADRWRAVLLGCGTVVGAALLAPVVTERPTPLLVALVLVLQVAATAVALRTTVAGARRDRRRVAGAVRHVRRRARRARRPVGQRRRLDRRAAGRCRGRRVDRPAGAVAAGAADRPRGRPHRCRP